MQKEILNWMRNDFDGFVEERDICRWDELRKVLKGSQRSKAYRFVRERCIGYDGDGMFHCKPIKGYNITTHSMWKDDNGDWNCSCQWFQKNGLMCSHIKALYLWFKTRS